MFLLIPTSWFIPPPHFLYGNHTFIFDLFPENEIGMLQSEVWDSWLGKGKLKCTEKYNRNELQDFFPWYIQICVSPQLSYLPNGRCCLVTESWMTLLWLPWPVAHQDFLSMVFPRQEFWSGLPFPSPGNLPNPGDEPIFPAMQADSLQRSHLGRL